MEGLSKAFGVDVLFEDITFGIAEGEKIGLIAKNGTALNVDDWGKKRLAYEIQKMREAYYYFIQFDAEATAPAEIEQRMRIMDNVLRYLCVRNDEA